jgi:prepilin-type N-terminal cleavage/methylation domain-containing protein
MKFSSRSRSGFTLLELLIVITIIGVLASMLFPAAQGMIDRSRTVSCASNLRQLWTAVTAAANDNDNVYPAIKMKPDDEVPDEPDAKELKDTLRPYGITEKMLQCPADMAGPKWFDKWNTSYLWNPYCEEEKKDAIIVYGRGRARVAKPSRVRLLDDCEPVHPPAKIGAGKTKNSIYADGHISLR